MVLTEKTEKVEVVFHKKKKYKRVVLKNGVEWRRFKTNNQVTREQQEVLEGIYRIELPGEFLLKIKRDKYYDLKNDSKRVFLESSLVEASENGRAKLAGIKRVKEITGWGLRKAKDYVDLFFERKRKFNS